MTKREALAEVCEALGISVEQGLGYLAHMFGSVRAEVDGEQLLAGIAEGKLKFKQFLAAASKAGVIEKATVYRLPEGDLDVAICTDGGERNFVTVEEKAKVYLKWQERAEEIRAQLWFPEMAEQMLDLYLSETIKGERSWRIVVNEFYIPMLSLQERGFPKDVVMAALTDTLRKNIWNPMYAVAVAKSEMKRRASVKETLIGVDGSQLTLPDGRVCNKYDLWCLRDPRYRELYINAFGDPGG
jgi:hypothetical protein